jgi:phosphomevalonate kinase
VNTPCRASAPGKLVLLGEYAVLFGAPAVVMAVNRRAVVTVGKAPGEKWVVTAPVLGVDSAECVLEPSGSVKWSDRESGEHLVVVERVLGGLVARGLLDPLTAPPRALELDTTAFFSSGPDERRKLGFGSSAALTVALASAVTGRAPEAFAADLEWLRTLVSLHREAQGGLGSGIDVAASLCGGVVGFELGAGGTVAGIAPIQWPEKIFRAFVWTGRSASTGSFLGRLQATRDSGTPGVDEVLDRLGQESERGVDALARNEPFRFLDAVDRFCEALAVLGRVIDMPILSDAHQHLRRLAAECGVHYKPSGAGGGDFGVCFSTEPDRILGFSQRAEADGFATPEVDLDPEGAVVGGM